MAKKSKVTPYVFVSIHKAEGHKVNGWFYTADYSVLTEFCDRVYPLMVTGSKDLTKKDLDDLVAHYIEVGYKQIDPNTYAKNETQTPKNLVLPKYKPIHSQYLKDKDARKEIEAALYQSQERYIDAALRRYEKKANVLLPEKDLLIKKVITLMANSFCIGADYGSDLAVEEFGNQIKKRDENARLQAEQEFFQSWLEEFSTKKESKH
jgi:hypothetical protein